MCRLKSGNGRSKESFIGEECRKLLACHKVIVGGRAGFFHGVCEGDDDKVAQVWELHVDLWKLLVEPIQFPQTKELRPMVMRK
jgi:hypothetical protein